MCDFTRYLKGGCVSISEKWLEYKVFKLNYEIKRLINTNANLIDKYHTTFPFFYKKRHSIAELYSRNEQLIRMKFRKTCKLEKRLDGKRKNKYE